MELSRRHFLQGTAGLAALGALGAGFALPEHVLADEAGGEVSGPRETTAFTYHPPNCGGRCSFKCKIRDGKLRMMEPSDWPDERYSLCCLRGLSEVDHVYSTERIATPLKRVGERGSGEFTAISWDEALDEVAENLAKYSAANGVAPILWAYSSGIEYPMPSLYQLVGAQTAMEMNIDMGTANGLEETNGGAYFGAMFNESTDWVNAKTIVFMSANPFESSMTDCQFVLDAMEAGAKLIVIDPVLSTTASKADTWMSFSLIPAHSNTNQWKSFCQRSIKAQWIPELKNG